MSTEYLVLIRNHRHENEALELYEHSSLVDLCVAGNPILQDITGEEMVKLAMKLLTVAGYVHGDDFVEKSIEANDPRRGMLWFRKKDN